MRPVPLPDDINHLVEQLRRVPGVAAVVLGGSRARGTADASSDVDLGLYYQPAAPIELAALKAIVAELDDRRREDVITEMGAWGPWINGGGWLSIGGHAVDLLYRDLGRVDHVLADVDAGHLDVAYQPGHPHAFVSAIYLAELAVCHPLWDPDGRVAALQCQVRPYPTALRVAIVQRFLWESRFSIDTARKAARRGDLHYVAGCSFRSINCLLQVLFAVNEQHWLNEKGALRLAQAFLRRPTDLAQQVAAVYEGLQRPADAPANSLHLLDRLHAEVEALASD